MLRVLKGFGGPAVQGSVRVFFVFRYQGAYGSVRFNLGSRKDAAKFLLRFRRARQWWVGKPHVGSRFMPLDSAPPLYSLRWIASKWCKVFIFGTKGRRVFTVPPGRVRRPTRVQWHKARD